jgi:hypothetical protein
MNECGLTPCRKRQNVYKTFILVWDLFKFGNRWQIFVVVLWTCLNWLNYDQKLKFYFPADHFPMDHFP